MSMPLSLTVLPARRRRSRYQARIIRARILFATAAMVLVAAVAWGPVTGTPKADHGSAATPAVEVSEPDQSIDTEGALGEWQRSDALFYVAER